MRKIIMAFAVSILCLSLCVTGVAALSIVALEGNENPFDLVYLSSNPTEIRAFQLYLKCDDSVVITDVKGVEPFQVFYGGASVDDDKIFRISGFTTESPGVNQQTTFAKVFTSGNGNITIFVEVLSDFSRERIIPENQDESYLIFSSTPSITVTPTQTSQYASPTQATPYQTPVTTPTQVQGDTSTPINTAVPLSSSSPVQTSNPVSTPTKSSPGIACSLLGLAGAFIMFKRQRFN